MSGLIEVGLLALAVGTGVVDATAIGVLLKSEMAREITRERRRLDMERETEEKINREVDRIRREQRQKASSRDATPSSAGGMLEWEKRREKERRQAAAKGKKEDVKVRERLIGTEDMSKIADFDDILEKVRGQTDGAEETNADVEAFVRELVQEKQEKHSLVDAYLAGLRTEEEETKPAETEEFEKLLFSMEEEYAEIVNDRVFFRFHKEDIIRMEEICKRQHSYRSYRMLKEVYFGEFGKLKKARKKWNKIREEWREPFEEAYIKYRAICNLSGKKPAHFYLNPETVKEDIRLLNQKTKELEEERLRIRAGMEAARILNEVMEEMGYEVLGTKDVTKKSGGKVHNTVFSYGEGSGIHVLVNGERITMEVVGLEDEDRNVSKEEAEYLEEEQVHFCDSFKGIEKALAKRGIPLEGNVKRTPPSKEYATILNMDGYTMTEHKSKTKSLSKVDKKAKRKQQGRKQMSE